MIFADAESRAHARRWTNRQSLHSAIHAETDPGAQDSVKSRKISPSVVFTETHYSCGFPEKSGDGLFNPSVAGSHPTRPTKMHHESQPFAVGFFVFRSIFIQQGMAMTAVATIPGSDGAIPAQFGLINLLKAGAAQLIVLHHLAFYGPMADQARPVMPALIDWLDTCARIAVQVFLVIGGFLAAKSLSPQGHAGLADPMGTVWRRYAKLVPPFVVAMLLAIGASAWAATWMTHDSISAPPDLPQLGAHALLLHSVLDYESLSAGAWYVAIDFQLYAVMTLLLWLSGRLAGKRRLPWLMPVVIMVGASTSLLHFNRDADWDVWAPYFFGSYGLGIMAWWASDPRRRPRAVALLLAMILLPTLAALVLDFRSRIALAVTVACVLFLFGRTRTPASSGPGLSVLNGLGRISYSVFLIHFPVCLLVNAAFTRFVPAQPHWQALGMLIAWVASVAAGAAFFRWVEVPLGRVLAFAAGPLAPHPLPAKVAARLQNDDKRAIASRNLSKSALLGMAEGSRTWSSLTKNNEAPY